MNENDNNKNRLILLRLALIGGEIMNAEFKPALTKPDRDRLERAGFLDCSQRTPAKGGRKALHLALSERGWGWIAENLAGDLPSRANAIGALQKLLVLVKNHLNAGGMSFAEFVTKSASSNPTPQRSDARERIRQAYFKLSNGNANSRVRLAELRNELPDIEHGSLDAILLDMAAHGEMALYPLENPLEIRSQDREAALRTPSGHERHLIYLGGPPS